MQPTFRDCDRVLQLEPDRLYHTLKEYRYRPVKAKISADFVVAGSWITIICDCKTGNIDHLFQLTGRVGQSSRLQSQVEVAVTSLMSTQVEVAIFNQVKEYALLVHI